ncbi:MAG: alpha-glucosidase [Lachnospiraceae bacterium]|nr:alpha-glucosidase [Lachnospiraceae bacterium]
MEIARRKWWHDKVIYEIYPKSFCDSDGDGIGDLGGILSKMDYLKELGVDILWICPCFRSPFVDQGYDVSNYYEIDPVFGTNEQMEMILAEAKRRGMSVILDLVANHCSVEHFWFREACKDPDGKYGKYFYIADAEEDELPTNWRSYFGGPVWSPLPGNPGKKYLHVFHEKQPDLNWENPEVRQEMLGMMKWWLGRGVRGFRIDAIMNIKKPQPLRSFLPDREDGLCEMESVIARTEGIEEFLTEMKREVFDPYDAFTVAEVAGEREEDLPMYMGEDGMFCSMFDFRETNIGLSVKGWYDRKHITPDQYRDTAFAAQAAFNPYGFQTNVIENHDAPRAANRFLPEGEICSAGKKMIGGLYFFMRGIPCIYQGQEIGMENIPVHSLQEIDDVSALGEYGYAIRAGLTEEEALRVVERLSRDNARTPMQWTSADNCGFSKGQPWMRINPNHKEISVEKQRGDAASILSFYKAMLALRKDARFRDTFVYGNFEPLFENEHELMAYCRNGDNKILVIANFRKADRKITLPYEPCEILLGNYEEPVQLEGKTLTLRGYEFVVMEVKR